jgi:hypothetical protein
VVNASFESNEELTTDEERKAFAQEGLKDLKFLYSNTDAEDPQARNCYMFQVYNYRTIH